MYPLWDIAIAPVIRAAMPRRIVEIGALRGETTTLMLESLGADVELHVVDPVPEFDPTEHEERFPGRYLFYRDISHNVLPRLAPMDVALIDGDHNWYTVYHELRMLRETSRAADAPMPVLIMHDVLWPYGRRDLYYAPEQIPEEFRKPYDQRGIMQGRVGLMPARGGGVNPTMNNALREGGPRNGVMTAFDDFLAEHDRPVRQVLVPIYFGLLIVVEEERLAAQPALGKALDELESAETRQDLLELSEDLRLRALAVQHRYFYANQRRIPTLTRRYLDTVKKSLLNEYYLENEARLQYLAECSREGKQYDPVALQDPRRNLGSAVSRLESQRRGGTRAARGITATWLPYAPLGRRRLDHLEHCLDAVRDGRVGGDLVSCGSTRGGDAVFMRSYLEAHEMLRRVWVADPFKGPLVTPGATDEHGEPARSDQGGDLNLVREAFHRFDLLDDRVRFLQGAFRDTLPDAPIEKVALLRIEADDQQTTTEALDALYDKVASGGYVIIDNYRTRKCVEAVDAFRSRREVTEPLERIDVGSVCWRKTEQAAVAAAAVPAQAGAALPARAPLAPPLPTDRADLSIVVVFYNMRREAERTLHALSRAYQRGIDDLDYEVIVLENGSADDQRLGEEFVRSFGPEFRYVDLGAEARPSPVPALNRGMAMARGENVAFMIDGAHVLTPGVLRHAMLGLRAHDPAMVVTQQWYVGPGQQPDAGVKGYDQDYEDQLFQQIAWPEDGYRLFRIGHFIGDRDWFDGLWESNCVFVPRAVVEQIGGFDESFDVAGGGYANLELYERIGTQPGLTVVSLLGEGSFHQVHGGTTTNMTEVEERNRRLVSYRQDYAAMRARHFTGHGKQIQYVGSLSEAARRTRARRMTAPAFWRGAIEVGPDGFPAGPTPMPDELKVAFTDSFWNSLDWKQTSWLGQRVEKCPTDLLAYQDLIVRLRPDWIVETVTGPGGRALFLASICDLVGHGRVLSVDDGAGTDRPDHPRIDYLDGDPYDPETVARVAQHVGPDPRALVILGLAHRDRLTKAFEGYAALVPVGSYVVLEDTITNGHPVWTGMGPGPNEAVKFIMKSRTDFGVDPRMELFGLTFNPSGYLKRLAPDPAAAGPAGS